MVAHFLIVFTFSLHALYMFFTCFYMFFTSFNCFTVSLHVFTGESLDRLMRAAAMRLGRAWQEVTAESVLDRAQWQHCLDAEGNPSGRILLCLQSEAEVEQVKSSLAGAVVSLGAEPRLLSVEPLVHTSKNDSAGPGSRSQGRQRNAGNAGNRTSQ